MVQSPLMVGDDVRQWQQRMADRGWRIAVDGIYGEQSRRVCVAFQQEKGLAVDGVVGPVTWTTAWTAPIT
jgi:peptidoglycan hydrolase-like protein with peptidoglycan-binding domain